MMSLLMQPERLCYPAMRPGMPGMQGMPAMGMLGPSMFPGMPMGGFGLAAGSGIRTQGGVAARQPPPRAQQLPRPTQQLPPPAQRLQHLGSGHSSADVVNLEAAGQPLSEAEPVQAQHSGSARRSRRRSGRSRSRSRSRSGRSRSRSDKRWSGGSPHSRSDKRQSGGSPRRRSRSGSRSPRRRSRSRSPRRASGGRGPGPALPLWLPPLLTAAVKSVAFDCGGAPFAASRLLEVLDDLRGWVCLGAGEVECCPRCNAAGVPHGIHAPRGENSTSWFRPPGVQGAGLRVPSGMQPAARLRLSAFHAHGGGGAAAGGATHHAPAPALMCFENALFQHAWTFV